MFLYQCINNKIKIHLLTKHNKNISKTLKKLHLSSVFDTIKVIKKNENKADFINYKSSIFIDDSFIERKKVVKKIGIPVFDTVAIESLINWKN